MLKEEVEAEINTEIKKFCKACEKQFKCDSKALLEMWKKMVLKIE